MRIFCPATLVVLCLPCRGARQASLRSFPDQGRGTWSSVAVRECAIVRITVIRTAGCDQHRGSSSPLFICHGPPVHAVGRVALSLLARRHRGTPVRGSALHRGERTGRTRAAGTYRYVVLRPCRAGRPL